MTNLNLILNFEYFDEIQAGEKKEEYRLCTPYWTKRLENRHYDQILFRRGYTEKTIETPYMGYEIKTITHPHFGLDPVKVYAIRVEMSDKIYFTEGAAEFLGISIGSLRHHVRTGRLSKGPWKRNTFTRPQLEKFKTELRPAGRQAAKAKAGCYTAKEAKERLGGISRQRLYYLASKYDLKVGRGLFDKEKTDGLIARREEKK